MKTTSLTSSQTKETYDDPERVTESLGEKKKKTKPEETEKEKKEDN